MSANERITKILFLCVANSARSQMAEAIAKSLLPESIDVRSAGSRPGFFVHPEAIRSLADLAMDVSFAMPKSIDSLPAEFVSRGCLVVRLCAEEECPVLARDLQIRDWNLPDPANPWDGDLHSAFAKTRAALFELISQLRSEIVE